MKNALRQTKYLQKAVTGILLAGSMVTSGLAEGFLSNLFGGGDAKKESKSVQVQIEENFDDARLVLKFGHDNKTDPFENPAHAFTGTFKSIIETLTKGEIKVKVYPSNQLGSAKEHLKMVREGLLHGTLTSVGAMSSAYPRLGIIDVPFAFNNHLAAYEVWDGPFGKALAKDIEAYLGDVVVLGFPDTGGFFSLTNSKRPIEKLSDFDGVRIRTMTVASHQAILNALGAKAYPLSWSEVYTGLQTGVIDGQMNPIPIISFHKLYEVQKYMTITNHLFTPYTLNINKEFFDALTSKEQKILRYAYQVALIAGRGVSLSIENSATRGLSFLATKMQVSPLEQSEVEKMRRLSQPAVKKLINEKYDGKAKDLLDIYLKEVKKANAKFD